MSKFSAGTFATTGLEQRFRHQGIDSVVVTGVSSDVCVSTTAREAADRGFRTVIVSDGCTTLSEQMHHSSLETFNIAFGWVRTADEVVTLLRPASTTARLGLGEVLQRFACSFTPLVRACGPFATTGAGGIIPPAYECL